MSTQRQWGKDAVTTEQELLREFLKQPKGPLRLAEHFGHETTRTVERWANEGIPKTLIAIVGEGLKSFKEKSK